MGSSINLKLWTIVHSGRVHDKFVGYKLLLSNSYCNDNGYYTTFNLWLQTPQNKDFNLKIADLNILNIGQETGDNPTISTKSSMFTFIRDVESAYMILFHLSFDERKELIASLNIHFQFEEVKDESAFKKSVLRGTNESAFRKVQEEIENIITCPLEISKALRNYKCRIDMAY